MAASLSVHLEFIESVDDLARVGKDHALFCDRLCRILEIEFIEADTEGLLLRHQNPLPGDRSYLAVIDARGERAWRAYFTAWHELTHLLLTPPQMAFPGFRRSFFEEDKKDPVESVVDHIAGCLAFYEPMFRPALESALAKEERLSFRAIDKARSVAAPDSSLFAAALASVRLVSEPICLLQVGIAYKKQESQSLAATQAFLPLMRQPRVTPKLRVIKAVPNEPARGLVRIFRNMRVPLESVLYRAYEGHTGEEQLEALEDQSWWETSSGGPLPSAPIQMLATRRGKHVYGLVIPS